MESSRALLSIAKPTHSPYLSPLQFHRKLAAIPPVLRNPRADYPNALASQGVSGERGVEMEGLTGSEIAGFVVGALLLGATVAAPRVDGFIASSQRRSLGMCKRCGDLRIVACPQCKGSGSVRKGGVLNLGMLDDLYESLGAEAKTDNLVPCTKCRSRGRLLCPECSKKP